MTDATKIIESYHRQLRKATKGKAVLYPEVSTTQPRCYCLTTFSPAGCDV